MIEVVIAALLTGFIVLGTLTGFDSASRATAEERARSQATQLAAKDEERLRGMYASQLDQLGTQSRTVTQNGTVFTVASSAQFVSGSQGKLSCEVTGGTADYLQTTSTVSWNPLGAHAKGATKSVSQSSIVNVPKNYSLLARVYNQNHEALSGATVSAGGTSTTTGSTGCVMFGGLSEKEVVVTADYPGYVTEAEEGSPASKEATLSLYSLTTAEFVLANPGTIRAEFVSNGVSATGDTFYSTHSGVTAALVGGEAGKYSSSALRSGLFPFVTVGSPPTANPYTVYAGDCAENEPLKVASVTDPTVQVNAGETSSVKVEVPELKLTAYTGTSGTPGAVASEVVSAKIINTKCSSTAHAVKFSTAGVLLEKYQPYASELQVCVAAKVGTTYYRNTQSGFSNKSKTGTTASFYLKNTGYTSSSSALTC